MRADELNIYSPTNDIADMLMEYNKNVSREVKFAEYQELRMISNRALDLVYQINNNRDGISSITMIEEYLGLMFGIKHRVRRLSEHRYLSIGIKTRILMSVNECEKQAIGWRNYFQRKARIGEPRCKPREQS